jgi:hypothetical protein
LLKIIVGGELMLSETGIALDLPLDKTTVYSKFSCNDCYRVQMHKDQTDR